MSIATIKHHGKKLQNLSKFIVAIQIACAVCRSATLLVSLNEENFGHAAQEYLILLRFLKMKHNYVGLFLFAHSVK